MNKTKHSVTHNTNEFPVGLRTAEDICQSLKILSAERLLDLANSGYIPHFRFDGDQVLFKTSEVKKWVAKNLMEYTDGKNLEMPIRVVSPGVDIDITPPQSIFSIAGLKQVPTHDYQPGVYFLCKGDSVMYVGQSKAPASRIGQHVLENKKDFDRAYLLPIPVYNLDNIEAALIKTLRPEQQGKIKNSDKLASPCMNVTIEEALDSIGWSQAS